VPGKNCRAPGSTLTVGKSASNHINLSTPGADAQIVKPRTRLDAVVKLRERDEDRARRDLAEAQRHAQAAEKALHDAQLRARHDARSSGTAAHWELADHAHARALVEARQAERTARAATERLGSTRTHYVGAHKRAEAVRKVVEVRRAELVSQAEASERKHLDEIATLLFTRT
jgi:flagellar export protein FliJ